MSEKITKFINSLSLFDPFVKSNTKFIITMLIIFVVMVLVAIFFWMILGKIAKKTTPFKILQNKLTSLFATCGGIGLILVFLEWQTIPYLSTRILLLILFISFLIWFLIILLYIQRNFFVELDNFERQERYKKYLPQTKPKGLRSPKKRR